MPRYEGGKARHHFTLSHKAYSHLADIARGASLSKSEAIERIIRSTAFWEGEAVLADEPWQFVKDHTEPTTHDDF